MKHNDAVIRQYCRAVGKQLPLPGGAAQTAAGRTAGGVHRIRTGLHHAGRTDCPRRNTGRSCTGAFERNCARACACLSEKAALAIYSGRCHNRSIRLLCCTHIWPGDDRSLCCIRRRAHCDLACNRLVRNRTITSGGHDMKTLKSTLALILPRCNSRFSFCFPRVRCICAKHNLSGRRFLLHYNNYCFSFGAERPRSIVHFRPENPRLL